jgi:hypothetical protein
MIEVTIPHINVNRIARRHAEEDYWREQSGLANPI